MEDEVKMVFATPQENSKRPRTSLDEGEISTKKTRGVTDELFASVNPHQKVRERVEVKVDDQWTETDPVETPSMFDAYKDKLRARYQAFFKDETEFAYFCMLPIPDGQKLHFIQRLRENSIRPPQAAVVLAS
jgi:hypothetical protein